jgi:hypothetical protein
MLRVTLRADQDFARAGFALETRGKVYRVPDGGVIFGIVGAKPAHARVARGNAHGRLKIETEASTKRLQTGTQFGRRSDGATSVIIVANRHIEESHHCIADIFVDKGAMFDEHLGRHAKKGVDYLMGFLCAEIVGELRERRKVGE